MKVFLIIVNTEEEDSWVWKATSTFDLAKILIERRGEEGIGDKYMLNYDLNDFSIEEFEVLDTNPVDLGKMS